MTIEAFFHGVKSIKWWGSLQLYALYKNEWYVEESCWHFFFYQRVRL